MATIAGMQAWTIKRIEVVKKLRDNMIANGTYDPILNAPLTRELEIFKDVLAELQK